VYEHTGRDDFRAWAESWTHNLDAQKYVTDSHDVGFQVLCSFGQGLRIANVAGYQDVILTAASSLHTRYNPTVGCVRSWDWGTWSFPVIIDNMMNLELLLFAADRGGPVAMTDHAINHAHKTISNHIRDDGTTYHVVDYDPSTGSVVWRGHHQGYADESTWSRGMAWAIYGLAMVVRYTSDDTSLAAAERLADWFLGHLPADYVPFWDFEAPNIPAEPRDTSAAAVAASALLELELLTAEPTRAASYGRAADEIIRSLCDSYLTDATTSQAILNDGYYQGPKSVIFGDYYFLEALMRKRRGLEWR
jgi:hypothetical protein